MVYIFAELQKYQHIFHYSMPGEFKMMQRSYVVLRNRIDCNTKHRPDWQINRIEKVRN